MYRGPSIRAQAGVWARDEGTAGAGAAAAAGRSAASMNVRASSALMGRMVETLRASKMTPKWASAFESSSGRKVAGRSASTE